MDFHDYQALSERTANVAQSRRDQLANWAIGLGETGEVQNLVKKHLYHGHQLDAVALMDEMGDVLWYLAQMCNFLDTTLEDVAILNIEKLAKRYPDGFSDYRSINREA